MTKIKPLTLIALAAFFLSGLALPVMAQQSSPVAGPELSTPPPPPPRRYAPHRIEIYPGRLLYRRCVDWYELQHRPSGTVLFPGMHCWWVRG
jgi:hypothetical protein